MSGSGGYKHRVVRKNRKRSRAIQKGRANLARILNQFEQKGQAWDPASNPAQLAALSHEARRLLDKSPIHAR